MSNPLASPLALLAVAILRVSGGYLIREALFFKTFQTAKGGNRRLFGFLKCEVCLLPLVARECLRAIEVSLFICVNFGVCFAWDVLYDGT